MNLVGYTIDKQCPDCNQQLLRNGNDDEWCICGYANTKPLAEFINKMKRISKNATRKTNN